MLTSYDKVIIVGVLIASLVIYGFTVRINKELNKNNIVVSQAENAILIISIDELNNVIKKYEFEFDGGKGVLEVKGDKVRILPMPQSICPNSICSKTGFIEKGYQSIVCLPNKLTVTFKSRAEDTNLDEIAF